MAGVYELDDVEEVMILQHRKEKTDYFFRQVIIAACDHSWRWDCAMHNDDAYTCTKCGETKFE